MNQREAIMGFVSWLTTRETPVVMGREADTAPAAQLAITFCDHNDLADVSDRWPDVFEAPPEPGAAGGAP